ncbi:glycosyltransferase [Flavobacterium sp.]|jgi:glycosyltransferase involved in cell wall biosynthesis|uniref:glycosyltransferase n=1 Tax=Flavobacterium sp. TaxID=239 RepID=UPI0037C19FCD
MKQQLLFVLPSLEAGGGEKSLVTLLNCIDYQQYDVDLVLFAPKGIFLKQLPKNVKLLYLNDDYKTFTSGLSSAIVSFLKQGKMGMAFSRLLYTFKSNIIKNKGKAEQYSWNHLKKSITSLTKEYDAAIGFLEKSSIYFVVDCVKAKRKIGFIHNDYVKLDLDASFDLSYFKKLNTIATVSEQCVTVLKEVFPTQKDKVQLLYNIVSAKLIHQMAEESVTIDITKPSLLSIGRLHSQKGFDIAVEAAALLKKQGLNFVWYIIGEGAERTALEQAITKNGLEKHVVLLGIKENPYPYIKQTTIFVQPSRYEGKSIALDEAKLLHKPIVVTNFTTAKDQINHLKNGIICEMDANSLADALTSLLQNESLQNELSLHLSKESLGSEDEIDKFYKIING